MKLTCSREALLRAVQLVSAAVAARTTKPILACIKATAPDVGDDTLVLTAYDTEVGIRYTLKGVDVREAGSAMLAPKFQSILRECEYDPDVGLTANDGAAKVCIGSSKFELPGWPVAEFPDLPEFADKGNYHEATAGDLAGLIRNTQYAADKKDSTRFALSGVLWEVSPKTVRLVATDSKRLAIAEAPATLYGEAETAVKASHLIPSKALALLAANLTDAGELVKVALGANEAMFQTGAAVIYTRLIEGRYPPYRDIIKQTQKQVNKKVTLPVGPFLSRLRQAAIMTDEESKRVTLTFADGKVSFEATGPELGKSEVDMPLEYDGEAVEVALDPKYVMEFLRAIEKGGPAEVLLEMRDGKVPVLFTAGEVKNLVMPLSG